MDSNRITLPNDETMERDFTSFVAASKRVDAKRRAELKAVGLPSTPKEEKAFIDKAKKLEDAMKTEPAFITAKKKKK